MYRATAADMAPSLAGVRTVGVRPAFQSALGVTLHVTRRLVRSSTTHQPVDDVDQDDVMQQQQRDS